MKHQALLLVISCMTFSIVLGGCHVEVNVTEEEEEGFLTVKNHSNVTITSIFIAAAEDDSWGADQLKSDVLLPGAIVTFTIEPGIYDVRIVSKHHRDFIYEADISSGWTTTVAVRFR
ncbi:hypothetical protein C6496_20660 [Candidatus Poribacteria bacterium]|nr:MAG: hypothetical protein C6496_20660 [Candidatus Poribacteria bacterium]